MEKNCTSDEVGYIFISKKPQQKALNRRCKKTGLSEIIYLFKLWFDF